jgi:hypothetical protein
MVFLSGGNQHDAWARFSGKHHSLLARTGLPLAVTNSEPKFRDLLEHGATTAGRVEASLAELSPAQWDALEEFAVVFFREFESYAPLDLFPAFRQELTRRGSPFRF